ncbi:MAG TPA: hypothetical protein ENH03_01060 [Candidatus Bathyarchaeota archaeon]|nr:hypothetical protein [Candidatus Bathyarchaeota archaeon]
MWDQQDKEAGSPFLSASRKRETIVIVVLLITLLSLAGYWYYSTMLATIIPRQIVSRNFVGIIRIEGYIEEPSVVNRYVDVINQAMKNESVKAVVLIIDSGGGYADYVEQIYLDLLMLKEKKPLVASVILALSGGYYIAVAADYIYVHPTSMVGNVGVKASMPSILIPSEQFIETGVYKWTGFSLLKFPFTLDRALENFVSAVESGRGDRLKISRTELKKALIYLGSEAVELGLADEIGSMQKAIEAAAERANLTSYDVVEIRPRLEQPSSLQSELSNYASGKNEIGALTIDRLNALHPPLAIHFIYLPSESLREMSQSPPPIQSNANVSAPAGEKNVVVDVSHGNQISWWVLDTLIVELAKRNVTVSFLSSWFDVESQLDNASALIVASPTFTYSANEIEQIKRFLDRGGLLLLFFDPAWEHIGPSGLQSEIIAPINSLSTSFGLSFAKGYLYNEKEYFGIYRNIYVRNFGDHPLTQNLSSLIMFTATHIRSVNNGIAWTSNETFSSMSERNGNYTVIAIVKRGNGAIIAVGDLTFLMEPYCYLEDNYRFIANLASLIAKTEIKAPEKEEAAAEKIVRPNLPVGTRKVFRDEVDGKVSNFTWIKVSDREIVVERVNQTVHYYLNEEGALERWTSDGRECVYDKPIPEPPFPLTRGKSWRHETNYTLTLEGVEYHGRLSEENLVEGFENVTAGDGNTYFCAKIKYKREEVIYAYGMEMKMIMEGYCWISSEAGTVKQEFTIKYYNNNVLAGIENERIILLSIEK